MKNTCGKKEIMQSKNAFTLAEVLITLAVIGVVAALTLPTLVQSYLEKQRVTQLKTTVSKINQAIQRVEQEYGTIDTWGLGNTYSVDESGKYNLDYSSNELFMTRLTQYINGASFLAKDEILSAKTIVLDGREFPPTPLRADTDKQFLRLNDGSIIGVGWFTGCAYGSKLRCADFWLYYPTKSVSRMGVDVFNFDLFPGFGLRPYGWNTRVGNLSPNCSKFSSNLSASVADRRCTAWAYYNENMDYLHCDDLNWQTKTKCK